MPLSADLRDALLSLLLRGASPASACAQLGLTLAQFDAWLADPDFQARLSRSQYTLSQNVAAALYRSAMEGSVAAQTFYLRHLPPPEWPQPEPADSATPSTLEQLTDDELLERFRARCAPHATEPLATDRADGLAPQPGSLP